MTAASLYSLFALLAYFGMLGGSSWMAATSLCGSEHPPTWRILATAVVAGSQSAIIWQVLSVVWTVDRTSLLVAELLLGASVIFFAAKNRGESPIGRSVSLPEGGSARDDGRGPGHYHAYDWVLYGLIGAFSFAKAFQLLQVWLLPIIVGDVMGYHAPRIAMWLEQGTMLHFPTWEARMNIFPKATHVLIAQIALFTGSFSWIEIVQWTASLLLVIGVYELALFVGCRRQQALLAAVASGCTPIVLSQSITAQNDILVSLFTALFVLFTLRGIQLRNMALLAVGGAAFGLAVGTKLIVVWFGPGLVIIVLWALRHFKAPVRIWVGAALSPFVGTLLLGSFAEIENYLAYGSFTGGPGYGSLAMLVLNPVDLTALMLRYTYHLIDPSGLPPVMALLLDDARRFVFDGALSVVHRTIGASGSPFVYMDAPSFNHPVLAWYGVLGFLVLGPLAVVHPISRRNWKTGSAVFCLPLILMWPVYAATFPYSNTQGRLFMPCFTLVWVALARLLVGGRPHSSYRQYAQVLVTTAVITFSGLSLYASILHDERKGGALLDAREVRNSTPDYVTTYETVLSRLIPPGSRVGLGPNLPLVGAFMDPALRQTHVFLVRPDGYTPLDRQPASQFPEIAREFGVDFVVSPRTFLEDTPPSSDQWLLTPELAVFSLAGFVPVSVAEDGIRSLLDVQGIAYPSSWQGARGPR